MENAQLFVWLNTLVLPQWLLMILIPKNRLTQFLVKVPLVPLVLATAYLLLLTQAEVQLESLNHFEGIKKLFMSEHAILAGWAHYLAFDLLVGSVILRHAITNKLPAISRISALFFTFMLGPLGLLIYYLQLSFIKKQKDDFHILPEAE